MKLLIFLTLLSVSFAAPRPAEQDKVKYDIELNNGEGSISYESDINTGNYKYRVDQKDGQIKVESGRFEKDNAIVEGAYEYIGDNGMKYSVTYVADENGYRPKVSFGKGLDSAVLGGLIGGGVKREIVIVQLI